MKPPAGWPQGSRTAVVAFVHACVQQLGLEGDVLSLEQGFDLPAGDTVAPDVSFTSKATLGRRSTSATGQGPPGGARPRG